MSVYFKLGSITIHYLLGQSGQKGTPVVNVTFGANPFLNWWYSLVNLFKTAITFNQITLAVMGETLPDGRLSILQFILATQHHHLHVPILILILQQNT